MKRCFFLFSTLLITVLAHAQGAGARLAAAFKKFESDSQLRSAISSLQVIEARTGKVVFEKNASTGLATASTLKVITAATAYELLGRGFRYQTHFGYTGKIEGGHLKGAIHIKPSGDPTLGSWRWKGTGEDALMGRVASAFQKAGIHSYGGIELDGKGWSGEAIPDGWIWQDIGNYYGAGAAGLNWRENQFDIVLQSGATVGAAVKVLKTNPGYAAPPLRSEARAAAKGTGDNAYVYYPLLAAWGIVRGTIPVEEKGFTIAAALPNPEDAFRRLLDSSLRKTLQKDTSLLQGSTPAGPIFIHTEVSPTLDSINYWFLKKSINLYGEALTKTIAYQKSGQGTTEGGTTLIRNFWKEKGIDPAELKMVDGSGLSPLNRVTTRAQVRVLEYARNQPWFAGYLMGFPEYNGMKMKSGTINGVKGFCGYHTARDGSEYIFSFLVNNYNGSGSRLVQKMYAVLDELK